MDIIKLLQAVSKGDVALILVGVLSVIQLSPIRINPWSALIGLIRDSLIGDLSNKIDSLEDKIDRLEAKEDKRDAVNKRVRILRFEDELQAGIRHSKDSFDQVLCSDITDYESYCREHPEFKNGQTQATVEHIKKVYAERLERRDFL